MSEIDEMYNRLVAREPAMLNTDKVTAFDEHEAKWVDRSEIVEFDVEYNGKMSGKTLMLKCLEPKILERNLRWLGRMAVLGSGPYEFIYLDDNVQVDIDIDTRFVRVKKEQQVQ